MEQISVFDMLKIGVGPSSSHTLGPWRAAERWIKELKEQGIFGAVNGIKVQLFGSLSLTGRGHATDLATILGLNGEDPEQIPTAEIPNIIENIKLTRTLNFGGERAIPFNPDEDICFNSDFLEFHSNGIRFEAQVGDEIKSETYYSIGGGFVIKEDEKQESNSYMLPYPIANAEELLEHCRNNDMSIAEIVQENERVWRTDEEIEAEMMRVWGVMLDCIYAGCHTEGILPGGLGVKRRAPRVHKRLIGSRQYNSIPKWQKLLKSIHPSFDDIFTWISTFAIAVNEVNASLGRVVTAPTNGSSGVIPAVLLYYISFVNRNATDKDIVDFLKVAGEVGSIFKKGATISAAAGGCQAEIGVSSAMAAAALCEAQGGSPEQALMAAEIAMEHHLGLTCDPIGGLVQVPCIERNSMGAVKAITACKWALESESGEAMVPLDKVVKTMWETAKDMNSKYKETSTGGLAVEVSVNEAEC